MHPPGRKKKLAVVLVTCARGIYTPLRPAVPPLTAQRSFACSVASLSQYPRHYLPGHCGLHHIDPAGCHLGWDRPSTWRAAHDTVPSTPANHPPPGLQDAVTHLGCQTPPGGCPGPVLPFTPLHPFLSLPTTPFPLPPHSTPTGSP